MRGGAIKLGEETGAFARGGNRLCFVDPRDNNRCIKVPRKDRVPNIKRAEKGFLAKLKPLSSFDDNYEEFCVFERITRTIGKSAFEFLPRCYGFVDTEYGSGLCSELIRDADGQVAISLKQYLWQHGYTDELKFIVHDFQQRWAEQAIPSRNLLLHNIVVQQGGEGIIRLVVIDGLGWPDMVPLANYIPSVARRKAARKAERLNKAIKTLLNIKETNGEWGHHGWLNEDQRKVGMQEVQENK